MNDWQQLEGLVRATPSSITAPAAPVPEAVERYFSASMPAGMRTWPAAVLSMRGQIKIGRWMPFRARQLLAPRFGTVWEARVAGVIVGSDRYVAGRGGMRWRLFNLVPFVQAEGADVTRSAAERAAGESIWVPSAVTPAAGTSWSEPASNVIAGEVVTDGHVVRIEHHLDDDGRLLSSTFPRWGDPDRTGVWQRHPFGVAVSEHRRFGDIEIPSRGEAGWHHGTERWIEGRFFRFEITNYAPFPS